MKDTSRLVCRRGGLGLLDVFDCQYFQLVVFAAIA